MSEKVKVALIDPVGGHGGRDYYDYGLAHGLGSHTRVSYYTCAKINIRNYENVQTYDVFGTLWDKKGIFKFFHFFKGYYKAFKSATLNKSEVFHLQFFSLGLLNLFVLVLAFFLKQKKKRQ